MGPGDPTLAADIAFDAARQVVPRVGMARGKRDLAGIIDAVGRVHRDKGPKCDPIGEWVHPGLDRAASGFIKENVIEIIAKIKRNVLQ